MYKENRLYRSVVGYRSDNMAMGYSSECIVHSSTNHFENELCIINYAVLY